MDVEIILDRKNKTYYEGEEVNGMVRISSKATGDLKHEGVVISLDGSVTIASYMTNKSKTR